MQLKRWWGIVLVSKHMEFQTAEQASSLTYIFLFSEVFLVPLKSYWRLLNKKTLLFYLDIFLLLYVFIFPDIFKEATHDYHFIWYVVGNSPFYNGHILRSAGIIWEHWYVCFYWFFCFCFVADSFLGLWGFFSLYIVIFFQCFLHSVSIQSMRFQCIFQGVEIKCFWLLLTCVT